MDAKPRIFPVDASAPSGYDNWHEFLVDNVQDIITVVETDGTIVYESPSIWENLGYHASELIGRNAFSLVPEEEVSALMEVFEETLANPERPHSARFRFRHASGSYRHLEARAKVVMAGESSTLVIVTSRDVTDRVAAERALQQSEARNRALIEAIPDAMVRLSRDGTYLDVVVPAGYRPIRTVDSLRGANVRTVLEPDVAEVAMQRLEEAIDTGKVTHFEYEIPIAGERVIREARIVKSGDDEAISIQRDITAWKEAERALKESESRFRALFESSPDAIFVEDLRGYVLDANPAAAELHGMSRQELKGTHVTELVPETIRESVGRQFVDFAGTSSLNFESESLARDGTIIPVEISINSFTFGARPALLLTVRDISRRKKAESELARLENFYRTILDELPADLAVMDRDGRMIYLNPASVRDPEMREWLIGRTGHDYCRKRGIDHAVADTRLRYLREAAERKETVTFDETLVDRSGRSRHILRLASPIIEPDGSVNNLIGYGLDVTDLKEAQSALRDSEALLRSVVTNMPVVVVATGPQGSVRVLEGNGLELLGLSPGRGAGRSVESVFKNVPQVAAGFFHTLAYGPRTLRIDVDGHTFEFWYNPVLAGNGAVAGAVAVGADITEITRKKEAIRESREQLRQLANRVETVREEERARIAREVHDVLGQAMTGLRMDVAWLSNRLTTEQEVLRIRLRAMGALIAETIQNIRRIATELRPGILDDLGLAAAIQWQAREFENRTEIACIVSDETDEIRLEPDQSTAVFRIFQEILTNVARHADATSVELLLRQQDGMFLMQAADDGVGIRDDDIDDSGSLGLLGMRERVAPWGGKVFFEGREGRGTTVSVFIPVTDGVEV